MGGNQSTGRSGGNDSSFKGPYGQGVGTYGTIGRSSRPSEAPSYPSGGHHDGGNNYHGGYGEGECVHDHDKYSGKTTSQKPTGINALKDIITKTSNAQHGLLLSGEKVIDMSKGSVRNEDIGVLVQHLQYQMLNLDKFDVSYNLLGYGAVENLFYTFRLGSPTATYNIKYMNLSNNYIGDDGAKYISSHLSAGLHPNLRCLDVSGNNLSYETCIGFSKIVQNIKQDIKILVGRLFSINTIIEGGKKQSDLVFGSKEEKQNVIKSHLKQAQSNGIDIQSVAVSKGIFDKIINEGL
jgi:hypothetical protein